MLKFICGLAIFPLLAGVFVFAPPVSAQGPTVPPEAEGLLEALPADHILDVLKKDARPGGPASADASKFNGTVKIGGFSESYRGILEVGNSAVQNISNIQGGISNNAIVINAPTYLADQYFPGLVWRTQSDNPTKPKLGIWGQMSGAGSKMFFGTSNSYVTGITNTALTIDESGRVGIGKTDPQRNLHVYGTSGNLMKIENNGGGNAVLEIQSDNNRQTAINFLNSSGSAMGQLAYDQGTGIMTLGSAGAERIRIDSNGNVGIGTTVPGAKFGVKVGTDQDFSVTSTAGVMNIQSVNDAWNTFKPFYIDGSTVAINANGGGNVGIGTEDPSLGGRVNGRFTINSTYDSTQLALGVNGNPRFALNTNPDSSWTMYDYASGQWKEGLTQRHGNIEVNNGKVSVKSAHDSVLDLQTADNKWLYTQWLEKDGITRRAWMGLNDDLSWFNIQPEHGTQGTLLGGNVGVSGTLAVGGDVYAPSWIYGKPGDDLRLKGDDDIFLSSNWVRYFDKGGNEYARISSLGSWINSNLQVRGSTMIENPSSTGYATFRGRADQTYGWELDAFGSAFPDTSDSYGSGPNGVALVNVNNAPLVLGTANKGRFYILGNGNVGIGTQSPRSDKKLDVNGNVYLSGYGSSLSFGGRNGFITQESVSASPYVYSTARYPDNGSGAFPFNNYGEMIFQGTLVNGYNGGFSFVTGQGSWNSAVAPTVKVRITEAGNVGIGTATPGAKLHVVGNAFFDQGAECCGIHFRQENAGRLRVGAAWGIPGLYSEDNQDIVLGVAGGKKAFIGSWGNFMTVQGEGSVGIGTTSPGAKLHVVGGGIIGTNGTTTNTRTLSLLENGDNQIIFGSYNGSWRSTLQIQSNDAARLLFLAPPESDYPYSIIRSANGGMKFDVGGTTDTVGTNAVTIDTAGNVGIGTTSPNATLHVNGGIYLNDWSGHNTSRWGIYTWNNQLQFSLRNTDPTSSYVGVPFVLQNDGIGYFSGGVGIGGNPGNYRIAVYGSGSGYTGGIYAQASMSNAVFAQSVYGNPYPALYADGLTNTNGAFIKNQSSNRPALYVWNSYWNGSNYGPAAEIWGKLDLHGEVCINGSCRTDWGGTIGGSSGSPNLWYMYSETSTLLPMNGTTINVGIGTNSPTSGMKLDVEGSARVSNSLAIAKSAADSGYNLDVAGNAKAYSIKSNSGIYQGTGSYMNLDPGPGGTLAIGNLSNTTGNIQMFGKVGIGTFSPYAKLTVISSGNTRWNTATFANTDLGPNWSHIHWGSNGDWYIRSANSAGKVIIQDTGGNVGIGTTEPCSTCKLDVHGGDINVSYHNSGDKKIAYEPDRIGLDVAELFETDEAVEVGDLLVVSASERKLQKSSHPYEDTIVGVVSGSPALLFEGSQLKLGGKPERFSMGTKPPVALAGRIPVKVSLENGTITPGDYLTSSSKSGVAMKATDAGMVIGVALEAYDGEGDSKILVFLNLGEKNLVSALKKQTDTISVLQRRLDRLERQFLRW